MSQLTNRPSSCIHCQRCAGHGVTLLYRHHARPECTRCVDDMREIDRLQAEQVRVECELNEKQRLLALSPVQRERALRERIAWLQQQMAEIQTKAAQRFTLMDRRKNTPSQTPAAPEVPRPLEGA